MHRPPMSLTRHATTQRLDGNPPVPTLRVIDGAGDLRPRETTAVLIAHGDKLARAGMRALLEPEADIDVIETAADGEQALALARALHPDVAIIDMALPGADAVEVTRSILTEPACGSTRVLLLSASGEDRVVFAALRAGAIGFLHDPDLGEVASAIRAVARGAAALSPDVAMCLIEEIAAQPSRDRGAPEQLEELTPREREVMALVASGLSNDEIADRLVVSRATAKTHVGRILGKLSVRNRAEMVTLAYESGLVRPRQPAPAD
jgi:DNA-binding NarL/FixJ family response regulator